MIEALSALQNGNCKVPHADEPLTSGEHSDIKDDTVEGGSWKPLLHNDLKSANVFCASGNDTYPMWPRVLMADFDVAQPVDDVDRSYAGTKGWQPPVSSDDQPFFETSSY